jgi:uncharacterized damage-inducible protein DinB
MERPEANEYHQNYQKYFDLVPAGNYLEMLRQNSVDSAAFFAQLPPERHDHKYAEGKWTVKEVLMHIIDTERVFSYRALAAARGDSETPVYRMDEELYARNVDVSHRTLSSLIAEFEAVRRTTEYLFQDLTDSQSKRWCNVVTHPMTARAIGYFMIGHTQHHIGVVKEKYLR